jgi:magnesium-transporting ATPase (P-type)
MKRFFLILSLLLLLFTVTVSSHPGRTDSNGGHWDRKEGTYHYHSGEYAGRNSSGSSSETADDIEENIVQTAPSEETKKEPSEKVIVMKKETPTKNSNNWLDSIFKNKTFVRIFSYIVIAILGLFLLAYGSQEDKEKLSEDSATNSFRTILGLVIIFILMFLFTHLLSRNIFSFNLSDLSGLFIFLAAIPFLAFLAILGIGIILLFLRCFMPLHNSIRWTTIICVIVSAVFLKFFTNYSLFDIILSALISSIICYITYIYFDYKTEVLIIEDTFNSKVEDVYSSSCDTISEKIQDLKAEKNSNINSTFDKYNRNVCFKFSYFLSNLDEYVFIRIRNIFFIWFVLMALLSFLAWKNLLFFK